MFFLCKTFFEKKVLHSKKLQNRYFDIENPDGTSVGVLPFCLFKKSLLVIQKRICYNQKNGKGSFFMKRLIALLLALFTLLSASACSSGNLEESPATEKNEATETAQQKEPSEISLPEGFSVGYSRKDITPTTWPAFLTESGGYADKAHDPMQITCVAISDGKNVALICTVDIINMNLELTELSKKFLRKNLDIQIPDENIFLNCSHTHTSIDYKAKSEPSVAAWKSQVYYKQLPLLAEEALLDLTPAKAYVGTSHTEDLTFVRRYFREDGTFTGILTKDSSSAPVVRHESDPDTQLRTLRFDREGDKKDVLMVNYQTHYGSAGALYPHQISADFIHPFRESAEKELDCHFSYCNGAGGNLVFNSRIEGERKYSTFEDAIPHLMDVTKQAIATEEEAKIGELRIAHSDYTGVCNDTYSEETVALAKAIIDAPAESAERQALVASSDFYDAFHASCVYTAATTGTINVPLTAITFGDIAFCAFPYEMFDTNGKECRDASPFKTTFICSLTGDALRYVASAASYENGGYEVYSGRFRPGSGEEFVKEMLRLLGECKQAN